MLKVMLAAVLMLTLSGCGFRPIYATSADGSAPLNQRIAVRQVAAPESVAPLLTDALQNRIALREGQTPQYDLFVNARESAERLAVQVDATVTRFNYRLTGRYVLVDRDTGRRITGSTSALASYNIVSSQYSTLFAERTAVEKTANLLAEAIERELLIQFSELETNPDSELEDTESTGDAFQLDIDPSTDLIVEQPRPAIIEPFEQEVIIEPSENE